ncbi:transglutaminase family protein [Chthonobacter albigriseus]|uniref:transglutaminase family protein n=1 Tax=Chthonobacter albigriseus TaxID=1683161 RepID=UPI0015EF246D|nr:transglutaminase family protein [Chthonobacter albigriseus]
MRLKIVHEIASQFDPPITSAIRKVRLTPRTYDGQYVGEWRIDVDQDCRLDRVLDAYGNIIHNFSLAGPVRAFTVTAMGEVEVDDTAGVLQTAARLPPGLFMRETPLTHADQDLRDFGWTVAEAAGENPLDRCHALMHALADRMQPEGDPADDICGTVTTAAPAVFASGKAGPIGMAHVFIAAARHIGVPARFVTGYVWRDDERDSGSAAHAWAEAHVDGLGWVGFDVTGRTCPTDAYVRVSASLDQNGAAFMRGANTGVTAASTESRATIAVSRG